MSENEQLIYDHVQAFIEPLHLRVSASYLFGFFVAKVLQGKIQSQVCLLDLVDRLNLDERRGERLQPLIEHLMGYIYHNFIHGCISLEQMLPNMDMPLSARIFSLGELIHAFLESMGSEVATHCEVTPELEEILSDFKALADMDMDEEDSEESERDYTEIIEYVRVGILLMVEQSHFCIQEKQAKTEHTHH